MRKKLFETFDEIYILNLHGNARIGERTPEGRKDENVFDIQQGVGIALFVKNKERLSQTKVFYADVYGLREEKYRHLLENDIKTTKWKKLSPKPPYYWFVEKKLRGEEKYGKFWSVKEIFSTYSSGVTTHRDHFVTGFTREEVIQKMRTFASELSCEDIKELFRLKETETFLIEKARKKFREEEWERKVIPYAYRPFDTRIICLSQFLIDRNRMPFMNNLLQNNIALLCMREVVISSGFSHIFVVNKVTDRRMFLSNRGAPFIFPLYLYESRPDKSQDATRFIRTPNFVPQFQEFIKTQYPKKEVSPEEIFSYIYAVLYSPTYRKRYAEFLKIDFPRIPFTKDYRLFKKMAEFGKELIDLHLLKSEKSKESIAKYPVSGTDMVKKVKYEKEKVYINESQYFEGIPEDVWEYKIGSYQVSQKWLKDRKDRRLFLDDIKHYLKITTATKGTIKIQERIDKIYPEIDKQITEKK